MNDIDERARRTRDALARTLMELAKHKPIDSIRVAELAAAAGIGRTTFYAHFTGLPDFLRRSYANMLERAAGADSSDGDGAILPVKRILAHMARSGRYGTSLRQSREWPAVLSAGQQRLRLIAERNLQRARPDMPSPIRTKVALLVASGLVALIEEWTSGGRVGSPEDLAKAFDCYSDAVESAFADGAAAARTRPLPRRDRH